MNEELIQYLEKLAAKKTWLDNEDFNAYDYSGGNYDDAFAGGMETGETLLAQEILERIKNGSND